MNRIKDLRISRGVTQDELANLVGVKQQTFNKYEHGLSEMKLCTMIQIADFFHTSLDYISGRTIPIPPDQHFLVCEDNLSVCNLSEAHLLHLFRQMSQRRRLALIEFLDFIDDMQEPTGKDNSYLNKSVTIRNPCINRECKYDL